MIKIIQTDWKTSQNELKQIRETVFILEQQVPVELEWDNEDAESIHLLAVHCDGKSCDEPIAACRIIISSPQAQIGRMAVLKNWRHQGIGSDLLQQALLICKHNKVQQVLIHAQEYIVTFYEGAGFQVVGERFMDAGIPHKKMILQLFQKQTFKR